jgi:hypothetical protein
MEELMSWTQPVCVPCWDRDNPDRPAPDRGDVGALEQCCKCGTMTRSGIYIRIDPATVSYPRREASVPRAPETIPGDVRAFLEELTWDRSLDFIAHLALRARELLDRYGDQP